MEIVDMAMFYGWVQNLGYGPMDWSNSKWTSPNDNFSIITHANLAFKVPVTYYATYVLHIQIAQFDIIVWSIVAMISCVLVLFHSTGDSAII
jgi:hypothetical protein